MYTETCGVIIEQDTPYNHQFLERDAENPRDRKLMMDLLDRIVPVTRGSRWLKRDYSAS